MSTRLLVTGASGFVAGSIVSQAGENWEVHALSRQAAPINRLGLIWHTTDILDFGQLRELFRQANPAAVIHAAGVADIDWCQSHQNEAHRINVMLTRELVGLCKTSGARLVYTSTDTVFRGDRGCYAETDAPDPVNYYGQTKLAGEEAVREEVPDAAIARLAIVMGLPFWGGGNSFLLRLINVLNEGKEAPVAVEEIRTPVDVVTLGRALLELAGNRFQGTVHLAGNDRLDRLEFSRRIAERLGYSRSQVVATPAAAMTGRAPRPVDVSLSNARARAMLTTPMLGLVDGLELVLATSAVPHQGRIVR